MSLFISVFYGRKIYWLQKAEVIASVKTLSFACELWNAGLFLPLSKLRSNGRQGHDINESFDGTGCSGDGFLRCLGQINVARRKLTKPTWRFEKIK